MYVEPEFRRRGIAGDPGRAGAHRGRGGAPAPAAQHRGPAARGAGALRRAGTARSRVRGVRRRTRRGVPGQGPARPTRRTHGRRDRVGVLRRRRGGDRPGGRRAARAALPRPGHPGAGRRAAGGAGRRGGGQRRDGRPRAVAAGDLAGHHARPGGRGAATSTLPDERAYRQQTERVLGEIAAGAGGVVLGRAAAMVLRDRADVLHVRLDGPPERRLADAVAHSGRPEDEVRPRGTPPTGPGWPTCGTSTAATRGRRGTTTW